MKRFLAPFLLAVAVILGSATHAEARDRGCRSHSNHGYSHSRSYSRSHYHGHSHGHVHRGYSQPRYYHSYNHYRPRYSAPRYYAPRYHSPAPCYRGGGISISTPGFGFFFRH